MDIVEKLKELSTWQVLERSARAEPEKTAVIHGNKKATYRELHSMAQAISFSIAGLGLVKGDRVAVYMPNSIELMAGLEGRSPIHIKGLWGKGIGHFP